MVAGFDRASYRQSTLLDVVEVWGEPGGTQVEAWVKNVGGSRIISVERSDVFFGPSGALQGLPYGGSGCTAPCWSYEFENDVEWNPRATLHVTLQLASPLAMGTHYTLTFVASNGAVASGLLPMPGVERYYLHNNPSPPVGDTASQTLLPFDKTLSTATTLYNYDSDRDADAGLLIAAGGSGPAETGTTLHQSWRTSAFAADQVIDGNVTVVLASAIQNFSLSVAGSITVYLRHYDGASYTEIASGSLTESDWQAGSGTWVVKTLSIPAVDYTVPATDMLELKLIVDSSSGADMWFAYDTSTYTSRIELP